MKLAEEGPRPFFEKLRRRRSVECDHLPDLLSQSIVWLPVMFEGSACIPGISWSHRVSCRRCSVRGDDHACRISSQASDSSEVLSSHFPSRDGNNCSVMR